MQFKPSNIYVLDTNKKDTLLKKLFPTFIQKKENFVEREFKQKDFHWKSKKYISQMKNYVIYIKL